MFRNYSVFIQFWQYKIYFTGNKFYTITIDKYNTILTVITDIFNKICFSTDQSKKEDEYTIEEAIEAVGFGKFQIKLLSMVGFAWVCKIQTLKTF